MDRWLKPMVEFIIVKLEFRNLLRRENCNNSVFKNHPCPSEGEKYFCNFEIRISNTITTTMILNFGGDLCVRLLRYNVRHFRSLSTFGSDMVNMLCDGVCYYDECFRSQHRFRFVYSCQFCYPVTRLIFNS